MGYIRFEKGLMTNLEETLPKELLRTNRSGAYSCSSILVCNTSIVETLIVLTGISISASLIAIKCPQPCIGWAA